jgi:G3E family GTPase
MVETIATGEAGGRAMDELTEITGVITAVDPARLIPALSQGDLLSEHGLHTGPDDERTVAETLACQVECASVLAVSAGPGLDDQDGARAGAAMLRQLNPAAGIVRLDVGELAGAAQPGFDVRGGRRRHPGVEAAPAVPPGAPV